MFEDLIQQFEHLCDTKRLAHAYIIENTTADLAPKLIETLRPILSVLEQDTHIITPEKTSITIDQIRALNDRVSRKPIGIRHLVVIYPADQMNTASCNALLKCLEEPPGATCFLLLTCNKQRLLPTIRSRTQHIKRQSLTLDQLNNHPDKGLIEAIYQFNTALLTDKMTGLTLYKDVFNAPCPLSAIHQLKDINVPEALQLSIQIIAHLISTGSKQSLWEIYDHLMRLNKHYQKSQNLNEKSVLDHIALSFVKAKQ